MTIYLFTMFKMKDSTDIPQLSSGTQVTAYLKEPCSAIDPVFKLKKGFNTSFNYVYASLGNKGRFYYVTNVSYDGPEIIVSCHVDPAASWRSTILNSTQFVERTSDTSRIDATELTDSYYLPGNNVTKEVKSSPDIFTDTNGFYVLGITAANLSYVIRRGGISYVIMTGTQLKAFSDTLLSHPISLLSIIKPIDYIYSCVYIPFNLPAGYTTVSDSIDMNDYTSINIEHVNSDSVASLVPANGVINKTTSINLSTHPDIALGDFVKYSPYTRYRAIVGPFGETDLPAELIGSSVTFNFYVDITDGTSLCEVYSAASIVQKLRSKLGIPTALAQLSANMAGLLGSAVTLVGGGVATLAGNPVAGVTAVATSAVSATSSMMPRPTVAGQSGSYTEIYDSKIHINEEFYDVHVTNNADVGHLYMNRITLSQLASGSFVKCKDARIIMDGYEDEYEMVVNLLNNGIYLE